MTAPAPIRVSSARLLAHAPLTPLPLPLPERYYLATSPMHHPGLAQLFRCYLDCDSCGPPYSRVGEDAVRDRNGSIVALYPESRLVCEALRGAGVRLAVASRSPVGGWYLRALELLELREWMQPCFIHGGGEIGYPGTKLGHFLNITKATGVEFCDMVFMDDEYGNIEDMEAEGVTSQYVARTGVTVDAMRELVGKWQQRQQQQR
mmetsp:Transcript_36452/g.92120  ORF Transcript_36452/g.92120 Transcript_36452/m.92120 type:complete len:205 (-) Transcript_36452:139-753(-)